jgi:hypothetical protein
MPTQGRATDLLTVSVNDSTTRSCARTLLAEVGHLAPESEGASAVFPRLHPFPGRQWSSPQLERQKR